MGDLSKGLRNHSVVLWFFSEVVCNRFLKEGKAIEWGSYIHKKHINYNSYGFIRIKNIISSF